MSGRLDVEKLMMGALDGTLDTRARSRLEAYLSQHPSERVLFEGMQGVDATLRAEPIRPAPTAFTSRVMGALPRSALAHHTVPMPLAYTPRPGLTAPQGVFLAMVAATVVMMVGFGVVALLSVSPDAISQAAPPATAAVWRAAAGFAESILGVLITLLGALFSQPITWVIAVISFIVASLWARLVLLLLLPTLRLVLV